MNCPNCDYPVPPGRRSLCPNCRYPLILDEGSEPTREAVAQEGLSKPTVARPPDETTVQPAVSMAHTQPIPPVGYGPPAGHGQAPGYGPPPGGYQPHPQTRPTPPAPSGPVCPQCQHVNPPAQQRCERCACALQVAAPQTAPAAPAPARARRSRAPVAVLVAVLLLALIGGGAAFFLLRKPAAPPVASSSTTTAPEVPPVKLDGGTIEAKASSELPSETGRYAIANTLDGDLTTAWNSNGDEIGPTGKVTLTYTFPGTVDLRQIEFFNGYQKSEESYFNNGRPHHIVITTDAGQQQIDLDDATGSQKITLTAPGPTKSVKLRIESVYRDDNTTYQDMAISDIAFYAIG